MYTNNLIMDKLLNRKEAAEYLRVKPGTFKKWEAAGSVKACGWLNGRPRYQPTDLVQLLTTKPEPNGK